MKPLKKVWVVINSFGAPAGVYANAAAARYNCGLMGTVVVYVLPPKTRTKASQIKDPK